MPIELRQFRKRLDSAMKRHADTLQALYDRLCPVDAGLVGEDGTCATCGRQLREPAPAFDFVPEPSMSAAQIEAQKAFWERRERQIREREAATTNTKIATPKASTGRDWARVVTQAERDLGRN